MVSEQELEEYKKTVQSIIDKYLPESQRFSVKDFNQEQLWYLCELLSESDNEKRQKLLKEIDNKSNQVEYEYENKYNEMSKTKELIELYIKTTNELSNLYSDIDAENTMNMELSGLDL